MSFLTGATRGRPTVRLLLDWLRDCLLRPYQVPVVREERSEVEFRQTSSKQVVVIP